MNRRCAKCLATLLIIPKAKFSRTAITSRHVAGQMVCLLSIRCSPQLDVTDKRSRDSVTRHIAMSIVGLVKNV